MCCNWIYEEVASSACTSGFITHVEAMSPPYRWRGKYIAQAVRLPVPWRVSELTSWDRESVRVSRYQENGIGWMEFRAHSKSGPFGRRQGEYFDTGSGHCHGMFPLG